MKKFYLFSILISNLVFSQQVATQLGSDIEGLSTDDYFGYSVGLNSAGNILAISAPGRDENTSEFADNVSYADVSIGMFGIYNQKHFIGAALHHVSEPEDSYITDNNLPKR